MQDDVLRVDIERGDCREQTKQQPEKRRPPRKTTLSHLLERMMLERGRDQKPEERGTRDCETKNSFIIEETSAAFDTRLMD